MDPDPDPDNAPPEPLICVYQYAAKRSIHLINRKEITSHTAPASQECEGRGIHIDDHAFGDEEGPLEIFISYDGDGLKPVK